MRRLVWFLAAAAACCASDAGLQQPYFLSPRSGTQHIALDRDWALLSRDTQIAKVSELETAEAPIPVAAPTSVHMALYRAGRLPHPYYNLNSELYRPAEKKVWYYRKSFHLPETARGQYVFLCFDGADYFARVWLNGELLGRHEGMFGGPEIEIGDKARYGADNDVVLEVRSANWGHWGQDISHKPGRVIHPWVLSGGSAAEAFYVFGMWRGARVEIVPRVHLERPYLVTREIQPGWARLHISAEIFVQSHSLQYSLHPVGAARITHFVNSNTTAAAPRPLAVRLLLRNPATKAVEFERVMPARQALAGRSWIEEDVRVPAPRLWWPNGMGKPELYNAEVQLLEDDKRVDSIGFEFGIRTLRTAPSAGVRTQDLWNDWQFEVNGRRFFLKGINWMPADLLLDLPRSRYQWLVPMARNLGVQLFRVWGAGLVEPDDFYAECNRNGILVWQEFQVSNMLTSEWPQDVWEEQVAKNVQRLRNHPSLALWCGGNEANPYAEGNSAMIGIFERTVLTFDPSRPSRRTSPDGGSVHEYPDKDPTWYAREYRFVPFMAETGMHNIPEAESVREVVSGKEFADPLSRMYSDEFARTHPDFRHHFGEFSASRVPRMLSRASHIEDMRTPSIEALAEASQIGSGEFYQIVSEAMQAQYPATTGLIPWVYKRPWPIIAIMLADGFGQPTAPYYFLKRTYEATHAMLRLPHLLWKTGETVPLAAAVVHAPAAAGSGTVTVSVRDDQFRTLLERSRPIVLRRGPSVMNLALGNFRIPEDYRDRYLFLVVELRDAGGRLLSRSVYWPRTLSMFDDAAVWSAYAERPVEWPTLERGPWLKPSVAKTSTRLEASVISGSRDGDDHVLQVRVRNAGTLPSFLTSLDVTGAKRTFFATDNYFWLSPGESRQVELRVRWRATAGAARIRVSSWNAKALELPMQ